MRSRLRSPPIAMQAESGFEVTGAHVDTFEFSISFTGLSLSAKLSGLAVFLQPSTMAEQGSSPTAATLQPRPQGALA